MYLSFVIHIRSTKYNMPLFFRTQLDSLRKELEDQEQSYKSQIASHEQKAHDNWVSGKIENIDGYNFF